MTMTLIQLRALLNEWGCSSLGQVQMSTELLRKMRDAIDAHIAGMGEAVAYCCPDDPYNSTAFSWPGTARVMSRHTIPLFTAPPIDIAAVREVIAELRTGAERMRASASRTQTDKNIANYLDRHADKLTAALPKETP